MPAAVGDADDFAANIRRPAKSDHKLQPSLFSRLAVVEADLRAMKDMLAGLKVDNDELRRDRDEWRWRAERLLAELQRGAWWRWRRRAAPLLEAVRRTSCQLLAHAKNKLAEINANRGRGLRSGLRGGAYFRSVVSSSTSRKRTWL